jgi:hypothetical protein
MTSKKFILKESSPQKLKDCNLKKEGYAYSIMEKTNSRKFQRGSP